jgi:hypothetical protein
MEKSLISRGKLQDEALSAVRREPGCAGIKEVSLTTVMIANDGTIDWHLEVTDPGDVRSAGYWRMRLGLQDRLRRSR